MGAGTTTRGTFCPSVRLWVGDRAVSSFGGGASRCGRLKGARPSAVPF